MEIWRLRLGRHPAKGKLRFSKAWIVVGGFNSCSPCRSRTRVRVLGMLQLVVTELLHDLLLIRRNLDPLRRKSTTILIAIFLLARCSIREFNLHRRCHREEVLDRIVQHTVDHQEVVVAQVTHDFRRDRTSEETFAALLLDLWDGLLLCCGVRGIELLQPLQSTRQWSFIRL